MTDNLLHKRTVEAAGYPTLTSHETQHVISEKKKSYKILSLLWLQFKGHSIHNSKLTKIVHTVYLRLLMLTDDIEENSARDSNLRISAIS
jgi:hypothetical protein